MAVCRRWPPALNTCVTIVTIGCRTTPQVAAWGRSGVHHLFLAICPEHASLSQQRVGWQADLFDPQSWGDIVVADCSPSHDKTRSLGPLDPHWYGAHFRRDNSFVCNVRSTQVQRKAGWTSVSERALCMLRYTIHILSGHDAMSRVVGTYQQWSDMC